MTMTMNYEFLLQMKHDTAKALQC